MTYTINTSNITQSNSTISISGNSNITGTSGAYLYSSGTGTAWTTSPVYTIASQGSGSNTLEVKGDANFEGDVKLQGKSLVDSLEKIEERLAILRPNEELEEKWEKLRGLRKAYMELEAEIKEKEQVWAILKR